MANMLALLSGANPRMAGGGPKVRLQAGTWRIESHGVIDSIIQFVVNGIPYPLEDGSLIVLKPSVVHVEFTQRGLENYISVMATRIA